MKTKFINRTIKKLGLKFPVEIRLCYKPNAVNCGEYQPKFNKWGDIKSHIIWIYMQNVDRGFKTTVIHELIHAWQEENNITEIHGKSFAKMAKCFKQYPDIYLKKIDKP
jgi:hypothetical protein